MLSIQVTYCVREERMKQNMTVRDLEAISGISKTHINAIENNKTHPTLYSMLLLASALQVDLSTLYKFRLSHM